MQDPLGWIANELECLEALHLRRTLSIRDSLQGPVVTWRDRELVNFGGNDYLGLAAHPNLAAAAREAIEQDGWGSGASPLVTGRSRKHAELEQALASFEGTEAALIFPSGFAANCGTVAALTDRGDVIFSDAKNHASIIDGTRQSRATVRVYPHGDVDYLESQLRQASTFRRRLIVTDSLFSMDGDLAPLVDLVELADRYDAMLMVDEAHASGVFGNHGRGVCEHLGVEHKVPIRVGTFSKALGGHGGFVAGSNVLIQWLLNRARPYVFSTAGPAAGAAAMLAALKLVDEQPERRQRLLSHAAQLRRQLRDQGWNVGESESQIVPLYLGEETITMRAAEQLAERGLLVPGIRPPTVPNGEALLRISLVHGHTTEMTGRLLQALGELRRDLSTKV